MEVCFCPSCGGDTVFKDGADHRYRCTPCDLTFIMVQVRHVDPAALTPRQLFCHLVDGYETALVAIASVSDKGVSL